jgi:rod shape-determining protein MreC
MRIRRRHAWGAALIALFALPVLRPQGAGTLEEAPGSAFAWLASVEALNPRLWERASSPDEDGPRVRELERVLAELTEARFVEAARREDLEALRATTELDRVPLVRSARVLRTRDPAPARRSLLIDRGAEDGLVEGCAVVSGGVFVGRVQVVCARSALVRLVTDPQSRLEVALRTSGGARVTGFLRRRGPAAAADDLEVVNVRVGSGLGRVLEHVPVLTSNADALVPAGLVVGYVSAVSDPEADGFPTLAVRAALDLARSTEVLVLLPPGEE